MFILCVIYLLVSSMRFGHSGRVKRIIDGYELSCGSQPRVASLRNASSQSHVCGATLLSENAALTAAHCVYASPVNYELRLNNYCKGERPPPTARVLDIYRHPDYDKYSRSHDIAVLEIKLNIEDTRWLGEDILPKCLFGISGQCMIAGYGIKKLYTNETSDILLAAKVNIVSLDYCLEKIGPFMAPAFNSGMMCAVGVNFADTCQGDSGGPLLCSKQFLIEGISSYGQGCGAPGIPGVYTGVAAHLPWIRQTLKCLKGSSKGLL